MKNALVVLLAFFLSSHSYSESIVCPELEVNMTVMPAEHIEWWVSHNGSYLQLSGIVSLTLDGLGLESVIVNVLHEGETQYQFRVKTISGDIQASFDALIKGGNEENVLIWLEYTNRTGSCVDARNLYTAQIPHN